MKSLVLPFFDSTNICSKVLSMKDAKKFPVICSSSSHKITPTLYEIVTKNLTTVDVGSMWSWMENIYNKIEEEEEEEGK